MESQKTICKNNCQNCTCYGPCACVCCCNGPNEQEDMTDYNYDDDETDMNTRGGDAN